MYCLEKCSHRLPARCQRTHCPATRQDTADDVRILRWPVKVTNQLVGGLRLSGTVALGVNDAEPASIGAVTERQFPRAHVFTMHFNTRFSVHLLPSVGWRGSM